MLVLVLALLVFAVALALGVGRAVKVELEVASAARDDVLLQALLDTAIARAMAELRADAIAGDDLGAAWRDAEAEFRGVAGEGGRWWLLLAEPDPGDGREVRWGVRDEASRLDVNFATREELSWIPGITDQAVDGLLDWRDEDDDPREFGAESAQYSALTPAYLAKNSLFESLEELLRVQGIDEAILWGEDRNRNGVLDPGEDDGDRSFPPDDADGFLDRGIAEYLTVFAREANVTWAGEARLDFNAAQPEELRDRLEAAGMEQGAIDTIVQIKETVPQLGSIGQLVNAESLDEAALAIAFDELTTNAAEVLPGRLNVNTAPRELLLALPGLEPEEVDAIVTARLDRTADLSSPAWLLRALPREKVEAVLDRVTTRSDTFTIHAVALLDDGRRFKRIECLVDRRAVPMRVLFVRDLTALGFPFTGERAGGAP